MLSKSQTEVLNFVATSIRSDEIVPTAREIAEATGFSVSGARKLLMELESLGYIGRRKHKFRSIKILRLPDEVKCMLMAVRNC